MNDALTLPALLSSLQGGGNGRPRIAVAVGAPTASGAARLARRLGYVPIVVTTPLELFWVLGDPRVRVDLVVGEPVLPTASGHELLRIVVEEWPHVCSLLVDGRAPPPERTRRRRRTRRTSRNRSLPTG